jgi:ariadne-1
MCDNDDSMDEEEYVYEYEDDGDEQQTDGDYDEYDYDQDYMKASDYSTPHEHAKMSMDVVPDGTYILKEYTEVYPMLEALESDVSTLLNTDRDSAELLLQEYQWSRERLVDAFFADPEKVMTKAGINTYIPDTISQRIKCHICSDSASASASAAVVKDSSISLSCRICGDEFSQSQGFAMGCDHWFCKTCYTEYLKTQVGDGPICIRAKCPEYKCHQSVCRSACECFLDADNYQKYRMYVTRNFIEYSRNMKYCPSPGCTMVAIGSGVTVSAPDLALLLLYRLTSSLCLCLACALYMHKTILFPLWRGSA